MALQSDSERLLEMADELERMAADYTNKAARLPDAAARHRANATALLTFPETSRERKEVAESGASNFRQNKRRAAATSAHNRRPRVTTKKVLKALEKVFAAEIEGRLPFQSSALIYLDLQDEGLIEPMERTYGGHFPCVVKGWQLTHAGRITYCGSCDPS